ncbi:hypothetical protein DFH07DRAFT_779880 [Mycena maculata]|uniref:Uncharacterized protein n=1 Tax=Mycena maculata TaxID=230809 RepID=A0AAD7I5Y0_9AGAR|nr:hypothetical protein DFH07DRAFT_779880 [Mycena maculata]
MPPPHHIVFRLSVRLKSRARFRPKGPQLLITVDSSNTIFCLNHHINKNPRGQRSTWQAFLKHAPTVQQAIGLEVVALEPAARLGSHTFPTPAPSLPRNAEHACGTRQQHDSARDYKRKERSGENRDKNEVESTGYIWEVVSARDSWNANEKLEERRKRKGIRKQRDVGNRALGRGTEYEGEVEGRGRAS